MAAKTLRLLVMIFLGQAPLLLSEGRDEARFFVSPNIGLLSTSRQDYNHISYEPKLGLSVGASFGVALNKTAYLMAKIAYVPSIDISSKFRFRVTDLEGNFHDEEIESTVESKQLLTNLGLQYRIYFSQIQSISFLGGINYTHAKERVNNITFIDGTLRGYFIGIEYEKKLNNLPISFIAEGSFSRAYRQARGPGIGARTSIVLGLGFGLYL